MDNWLNENMANVLLGIEILMVSGFLFIFVLFFAIKWHFAKQRKQEQQIDEKGGAS